MFAKLYMLYKGVDKPDALDSVAGSASEGETCCTRANVKPLWALAALFASAASVYGQASFDLTPFVGGRFGGTFKVQQDGQSNSQATLSDSFSFGVSAGFRYDGDVCDKCNVIEFRWMRQYTHVSLSGSAPSVNPLSVTALRPAVTLDHFLGDFTREFPVRETQDRVNPFLTVSLGAARLSTPADSRTRFEFGIGGGVKVFPWPRWGIRFQVEYLPMVMYADVQRVLCTATCFVTLNGGVMNQFAVNVGPVFRF